MSEIAPGVHWLRFGISNVYLVGEAGGPWVVIDSCFSGHFEAIRSAAETIYGEDARPEAILLTHAHPDHAGSALPLAVYWNVPVYAHPLELPYLNGKSDLPPSDPTVGGVLGFVSRFASNAGADFGDSIHPLPESGVVPGLPDWKWYATPGHTPGHVSFFRESDRVLIAGDAVLTVHTDSIEHVIRQKQWLSMPPKPATYDWFAVRRSLLLLASLRPAVIASGHGVPMSGDGLADDFQSFAVDSASSLSGRYVAEPARFDENGIVWLPPPAPDPLPKIAAVAGIAAAVLIAGLAVRKALKNREES